MLALIKTLYNMQRQKGSDVKFNINEKNNEHFMT